MKRYITLHKPTPQNMFVKLFTQILDSSIADDRKLRHFFTDLLLCADCKGYIIMTPSAIARRIGASIEEVEWGISELEKPDPQSKTKDGKGKRIEPLGKAGYGWRILNYESYRALKDADQMREATRRRVNRYRAKKKSVTLCNADVTPCNANTEADTEAEANTDIKTKPNKRQQADSGDVLPFDSEPFKDAWTNWKQHRIEIKKKLTPSTIKSQLKTIKEMGEERAIAAIEYTIGKGWQGLFEPTPTNQPNRPNRFAGIQEEIELP